VIICLLKTLNNNNNNNNNNNRTKEIKQEKKERGTVALKCTQLKVYEVLIVPVLKY
jgi:hypothetical protein